MKTASSAMQNKFPFTRLTAYILFIILLFPINFQQIQIDQLMKEHTLSNMSEGPCAKQLEKTLQSLNVQRQAYYGKCFVGNNVQKMLKVRNN